MTLVCIVLFLSFSCNKDTDLLAEYVIENPQAFVVNDVVVTLANNPIVIEPLSNDTFKEPEKVTITEITPPKMGTAEVQADNTVVYTPDPNETGADEFDYTAIVTNPDNSVSSETGKITVTVTSADTTSPITGDNVYYVTTSGKSSNNGATEATAWSITHAMNTATAGDVVYIKAGDYVIDYNLAPKSGSSSSPIKFIGYKTTPGDILSEKGATITYADYLANGNDLDPKVMPLIRRSSVQMSTQNNTRRGIDLGGKSYVEIENLQFKWQQEAISAFQHGAGIKLRNLVIAWVGNFDPVDTWTSGGLTYDPPLPLNASGGESTNQVGKGIDVSGAIGALIENCTIINPGHVGIVSGTITSLPVTQNAVIRGCKVYSDQNINPADYYLEMYNSQNGLIEDCEVYRIGDLVHQGHGIDFKKNSTNNIARNCYVENTFLEVNLNSNYNTFENITIQGKQNYKTNRRSGGIKIYYNSNFNTFKNIKLLDTDGVFFADVRDEIATPSNVAGHDNEFIDCLFYNAQINAYRNSDSPITFEANTGLEAGGYNNSPAYNNKFYNCTFDTAAAMFTVNRPNYGNEFIECNFINIPLVYSTRSWGDALNAIFTNCNFENSQVP